MKKLLLVAAILIAAISAVSAQRISRDYKQCSLSSVLADIDRASEKYKISFIYNEIEDFTVTKSLRDAEIPDAVREVIGFYPIKAKFSGNLIFIEYLRDESTKLSGRVTDKQGKAVSYANVMLYSATDTAFIDGGVTNENGDFVIPCLPQDLLLKVSSIGYSPVSLQIPTARFNDKATITLSERAYQLGEVKVDGKVPLIQREDGKLIFNAKNITGAINTVDLLRYVPGIIIGNDDISLFGSDGVKFYINGKEQKLSSKEMLNILKSYASSDIDKIEIIQNPSARYSAEGNAGIINIKLKRRANDFIGGGVTYARAQGGEEHDNEANANIIYNQGKVSTSLNASATFDKESSYKETNTTHYAQQYRDNTENGKMGKDEYSLRWQLDYAASEDLSLGAYALFSYDKRNLGIDGKSDTYKEISELAESVKSTLDRSDNTKTYAFNLNAEQKLNSKGGIAWYNIDYYRMRRGDNTTAGDTDPAGKTAFGYGNDIMQKISNYSVKADFSMPFADNKINFGSHFSFTDNDRQLDYSISGLSRDAMSDHFSYREQVWAIYAEYSRKFNARWKMNAGLRYEHTWTKTNNRTIAVTDDNDYGRLFPSLNISFNPDKNNSLNWSFSNRITRPNMILINPNTIYHDRYSRTEGNTKLKPTYLYRAAMGYTLKGALNFDFYFAYLPDKITSVGYTDNNGVTTRTSQNASDENSAGVNIFYSFYKLKWLSAFISQALGYTRTTSHSPNLLKEKHEFGYVTSIYATLFLDRKRNLAANINFIYTSGENNVARTIKPIYTLDAGLQYSMLKNKLTIGLNCKNLLASKIRGTEYLGNATMDFNNKYNYCNARLSLTYNWGARLRTKKHNYGVDDIKGRTVNDF